MMQRLCRTTGARALPALAVAIAFALCAGCASEVTRMQASGGTGPMPPKPRPIEQAPQGARVNAVALQVAPKPRDTNGNGYPDSIQVAAYLFANPHPSPIYEEGAFVFTLYVGGQASIADSPAICEWRVEGDRLERAKVGNTLYGLTYSFDLSLLETSGDTFPLMTADLTCRFEPADGSPAIDRREVHTLQIGASKASN